MLKTIIDKEAREMLGSVRFVVAFVVCVVLILLSFYAGAQNFQLSQARYEAAKAENLRQMEGLTDWFSLQQHRIFLPPNPLTTLVSGISNDIGRTIEVEGRGELTASGSRFAEEPVFAVFRFLDLEFLFSIILSLFAILLGYDAICGEKEQGTLRLSLANPVPRDIYIMGKLIGSFLSLAIPLIIALALGCLLLPLMGVSLNGAEWLRLILIILSGLLYFGAFLTLSVFISALTERSSSSFLIVLVIWIMAVLIVPRAAVLMAARAVAVPTVDEISTQKARFAAQLWQEDRERMGGFKPAASDDPHDMVNQFNRFMDELENAREKKMSEFGGRLNEERFNGQRRQQKLAFTLARVSPAASLSLAVMELAGTSLELKDHFVEEAASYQSAYANFIKEKTGLNPGGRIMVFRSETGDEPPKPIDPNELPEFTYHPQALALSLNRAVFDLGILAVFNIVFFLGAFLAFRKYDVR